MRLLITGSTGLLGNNLVRLALEDGHRVAVLIRSKDRPPPLADLDVECFFGDVTDAASIQQAAAGVDAILHAAAFIHLGWRRGVESTSINVEGTKHIVRAAEREQARLVHISTVNTLSIGNPQGSIDEDHQGDGQVPCNYVVSKRAAEAVTLRAAEEGLEACVVHPGFMLGPWDWKPSSGRMLIEVGKRWTPIAPSGGCSVCDVRDVARGILQAMERGTPGRRYILAGENMSYFDLWTRFCRKFNKRPPIAVMKWPTRWLVGQIGDVVARVRGNETDINSAALRMSSQFHCYSSQRAIDELGYSFRPADEAIAAAFQWFLDRGYLAPAVAASSR